MSKQKTEKQTEPTLDEAIQSIVKTPEELAEEHPEGEPLARARNQFTKEEASQKRNIRQIYPEYYKLYERRSRLIRNLKKPNLTPSKVEEYKSALSKVEEELKTCSNKPKRSKFSQ
jgi:hypothetical protein